MKQPQLKVCSYNICLILDLADLTQFGEFGKNYGGGILALQSNFRLASAACMRTHQKYSCGSTFCLLGLCGFSQQDLWLWLGYLCKVLDMVKSKGIFTQQHPLK